MLGVKQSCKTFEVQGVDNIEKLEQGFLGTLRSGKFNQTMTEETIPDSGLKMLNADSLHNYRFALGKTSNLSDLRDVNDADFCESVNITNNGLLTYAGLLMFGKKLVSWKTLTGVSPTIESSRTVTTVTFPLKSAILRLNNLDDANSDIIANGAKNDAKMVLKWC